MAGKNVDDKLRCSFCNKTQDQVRKLVAGPKGVYICDECIELCGEILAEELEEEEEKEPVNVLAYAARFLMRNFLMMIRWTNQMPVLI